MVPKLHIFGLGLVLICLGHSVSAFYDGTDVENITPSNIKSLSIAVVEFYAPWCGHCQQLKPEWIKAATALKGAVKVAAVNADEHKSLAQEYNIKGFPTIMFMYKDASGKIKTVPYQGGRTAKDIVQWTMQQTQKVVNNRLGVKSGSSSSGAGNNNGGGDGFYGGTNVVQLDDSNFHSQVGSSDDLWFIEFYAPWCGHCKNLKPTWIDLASSLADKVKVGAVDCTQNQATCGEFSVNGFPTIKFFGSNKDNPESYEGGRDLGSLSAFAMERYSKNQPPPEVRQLTDQEMWEEHCVGHAANPSLELKEVKPKQLCLVAFLPHILDSKADGRNAAIEMLKELALKLKDRPFSWFWSEGAAQPGLEANVDVGGFGYPAFVAINPSKGKYATLKGAFNAESLREFMDSVRSGRAATYTLNGELVSVEQRDPWDGLDGEETVEEEFSLEDLGLSGGSDGEL